FSLSFFFSSRRRHTRSKRDWSSDVCSSDLSLHSVVSIHLCVGALMSLCPCVSEHLLDGCLLDLLQPSRSTWTALPPSAEVCAASARISAARPSAKVEQREASPRTSRQNSRSSST